MIHNPHLFQRPQSTGLLTSHLDILPTMLGLAGIDPEEVARKLTTGHSEIHPLMGRDLSPLILEGGTPAKALSEIMQSSPFV